jgi:hypothetical protein
LATGVFEILKNYFDPFAHDCLFFQNQGLKFGLKCGGFSLSPSTTLKRWQTIFRIRILCILE